MITSKDIQLAFVATLRKSYPGAKIVKIEQGQLPRDGDAYATEFLAITREADCKTPQEIAQLMVKSAQANRYMKKNPRIVFYRPCAYEVRDGERPAIAHTYVASL